MSLDQELRTVLGDRAESRQAPTPDIEALKARGLVRRRRRRLAAVAMSAVVGVVVLAAGVVWSRLSVRELDTGPVDQPAVFVGRWASADVDGSHQTMVIRTRSDGAYEMVLRDDHSGPCSGPSTDTGTGRLGARELVVGGISTVCSDGGTPMGAGESLTFHHHPRNDTLTDDVGVVWSRE